MRLTLHPSVYHRQHKMDKLLMDPTANINMCLTLNKMFAPPLDMNIHHETNSSTLSRSGHHSPN